MLTDPRVGFSQPAASYALSLFNFGGVGGALAGAIFVQRIGSRAAMLSMTASITMRARRPSSEFIADRLAFLALNPR